jgi:hypothetical protein
MPICPYISFSLVCLYVFVCLLICLYAICVSSLLICPYICLTHSFTSNYKVFVLINRLKAFVKFDFNLDFVIALAGFKLLLIHFTFAISLCLYAWQRHIISIIRRFSYMISNLIKHLYNNLKSV